MMDPEVQERIAARRAELDGLEEQLVKRLAEVRAERDELAVAERVWQRMSEQLADERAQAGSPSRGGEVVLIDGTLIPTQRRTGTANRPNYSGEHHRHGLHVLALTDERGRMIWISAARPGRTHDITAARRDRILSHPHATTLTSYFKKAQLH
ncbi:transposase family protein [Nonomuraea sp. NPDC048916]|uniref:transposase family protein n=1 Tax=Nonomuraea sp. NPDC048916 TaxID=3154232 RepID=UPI0033C15945